jgi:hypothetical protein
LFNRAKELTKHDSKLAASMQSFRDIRALGMIGMDKEKMVGSATHSYEPLGTGTMDHVTVGNFS